MSVQLSIILPVDNAPLSELMMPLASLNNQLGLMGNQVEILLVDNGEFHLDLPAQLNLFVQLTVRTITPDQVCGRMAAFEAGVKAAKGEYIMLLDANNQLYHPFTLQNLFGLQAKHPDADIIGGATLLQGLTKDRQPVYRAGRSQTSLHGLMIRRALLMSEQVQFDDQYGEYSEEFTARLVRQAAGGVVEGEDIACVIFSSRTHAITGQKPQINEQWVLMMAGYLAQLRATSERFDTEYAKFIVRFYSQVLQVPAASRMPLTTAVAQIVKTHVDRWPAVQQFVAGVKLTDKHAQAPWVAAPASFANYLDQLTRIAGVAIRKRG